MSSITIEDSSSKAVSRTGSSPAGSMAGMLAAASDSIDAQLEDFAKRLADALAQLSEVSSDAKHASLTFHSSNLLKRNSHAYQSMAATAVRRALNEEIELLCNPAPSMRGRGVDELALVPYEELEKRLLLNKMASQLETRQAGQLRAIRQRVAHLLGRDDIARDKNPFRPEVFISALNHAWCEFNPDVDTHALVLPLLREEVFVDLGPVYVNLNKAMAEQGVLPDLTESYSIEKNAGGRFAARAETLHQATLQQLRKMLTPDGDGPAGAVPGAENLAAAVPHIPGVPLIPGIPMTPGDHGAAGLPAHPSSGAAFASGAAPQADDMMVSIPVPSGLAQFLSNIDASHALHRVGTATVPPGAPLRSMLGNVKAAAPQGSLSRVDESTVDLMANIFNTVFRDQNIPHEIKNLIGLLQLPVLRSALQDKEFFFKEEHPARRLIELLSKTGVGWDKSNGQEDPLYQAIKRNVDRVHQEFDAEGDIFSHAVSDLERFIEQEEQRASKQLATPVRRALRQERLEVATEAARQDIATRIDTGDVVAFVESFLQNRWVKVLALAYSVQEAKPKAIESAVQTMDDLIWSVKPKATAEERKELVAKLPHVLAMLNKWFDIVKLDNAERLQFLSELAECHASIVRAPLDMTPERRIEIAVEAAKEAAERRLQKKEEQATQDEEKRLAAEYAESRLEGLERGTWFEFDGVEDEDKTVVQLKWISPMKSLFIFSPRSKSGSFSMPAEKLAMGLELGNIRTIQIDGLINRALTEALGPVEEA
ncbi:MAG TPA: DUF1631 family protein [Burkholderiaceae bacterium]